MSAEKIKQISQTSTNELTVLRITMGLSPEYEDRLAMERVRIVLMNMLDRERERGR